MAELGHEEGKNFTFDLLQVLDTEEYEAGYREVVARGVDIVIAGGPELALKGALAATTTLPIVMVAIDYDPLARGYIKSLARPSGNVTGVFLQQVELAGKRLQVLKDGFSGIHTATVFWDRISADQWQATQGAGARLGLQLAGVELREQPYDYERALAQVPLDFRQNIVVMSSPFFFSDRARLADFALRNHIASMFAFREWVDAGGLLSYGPSITGMYQRAAEYVDRIAKGAEPADLPIEQPTKFELVINLKTARASGLTVPPSLLARADQVIE
jgi:putative ABC transport system substrate-binding protein